MTAEVVGSRKLWDGEYVELLREPTNYGPAMPVPGLKSGGFNPQKRRTRAFTLAREEDLRPVAGTSGPPERFLRQCEVLAPDGVPTREWPDTGPRLGQQLTLE